MFSYRGNSTIERAKNDRFRAKKEKPYGLKREDRGRRRRLLYAHRGKEKNTSIYRIDGADI